MKSTFFYKTHPNLTAEHAVEADHVTFEPGFVVFRQDQIRNTRDWKITQKSRIVLAVHSEACHGLREEPNEPNAAN